MALKFRDYYEVLGIKRDATQDQIRQAFRKLARKLHPDVNPGDIASEEKFKEINEANEVLSDPEKRKRYDQLGANWKDGDSLRLRGSVAPMLTSARSSAAAAASAISSRLLRRR